jgi:hypothetical protein
LIRVWITYFMDRENAESICTIRLLMAARA